MKNDNMKWMSDWGIVANREWFEVWAVLVIARNVLHDVNEAIKTMMNTAVVIISCLPWSVQERRGVEMFNCVVCRTAESLIAATWNWNVPIVVHKMNNAKHPVEVFTIFTVLTNYVYITQPCKMKYSTSATTKYVVQAVLKDL